MFRESDMPAKRPHQTFVNKPRPVLQLQSQVSLFFYSFLISFIIIKYKI